MINKTRYCEQQPFFFFSVHYDSEPLALPGTSSNTKRNTSNISKKK